jgi:hypothetical protein
LPSLTTHTQTGDPGFTLEICSGSMATLQSKGFASGKVTNLEKCFASRCSSFFLFLVDRYYEFDAEQRFSLP